VAVFNAGDVAFEYSGFCFEIALRKPPLKPKLTEPFPEPGSRSRRLFFRRARNSHCPLA